eukprot:c32507_g1_i1 orf=50-265(+)
MYSSGLNVCLPTMEARMAKVPAWFSRGVLQADGVKLHDLCASCVMQAQEKEHADEEDEDDHDYGPTTMMHN